MREHKAGTVQDAAEKLRQEQDAQKRKQKALAYLVELGVQNVRWIPQDGELEITIPGTKVEEKDADKRVEALRDKAFFHNDVIDRVYLDLERLGAPASTDISVDADSGNAVRVIASGEGAYVAARTLRDEGKLAFIDSDKVPAGPAKTMPSTLSEVSGKNIQWTAGKKLVITIARAPQGLSKDAASELGIVRSTFHQQIEGMKLELARTINKDEIKARDVIQGDKLQIIVSDEDALQIARALNKMGKNFLGSASVPTGPAAGAS